MDIKCVARNNSTIVEGFKTSFKCLLGTLKIMDIEIERFECR